MRTNALVQESVRAFYTGWYKELVTELPRIVDGHVYPMTGPGLGTRLLPDIANVPMRMSGARPSNANHALSGVLHDAQILYPDAQFDGEPTAEAQVFGPRASLSVYRPREDHLRSDLAELRCHRLLSRHR